MDGGIVTNEKCDKASAINNAWCSSEILFTFYVLWKNEIEIHLIMII